MTKPTGCIPWAAHRAQPVGLGIPRPAPRIPSPASRKSSPGLTASRFPHPASRGFTLIELLVVVAIIVILIAFAGPTIGPALSSNQQSQAVTLLTGAIARAQASGAVGIRIERAYKVDKYGMMIDAAGNTPDQVGSGFVPVWLNHQQMRLLKAQPGMSGFSFVSYDDPIPLPAGAWIAPSYCLNNNVAYKPEYFNPNYFDFNNVKFVPSVGDNFVSFSPLDTFYIGFDASGAVRVIDSSTVRYHDITQVVDRPGGVPVFAYVRHPSNLNNDPQSSARGVIFYDRKAFEERAPAERAAYLWQKGSPYYINRFLGTLISGGQQ